MITTRRYDYIAINSIQIHPDVRNHRPLNQAKVAHYAEDILQNGLLEPLVVWERNHGEAFLIGGFHRKAALGKIRQTKPDYFDRVDTRVVAGTLDEMIALNLKLNADRLDTRTVDFFDTVIYLANANWEPSRIGEFLDRSESWVQEILRFVPSMDPRIRKAMEENTLSWGKAKKACQQILSAPPGQEKIIAKKIIEQLFSPAKNKPSPRPLPMSKAIKRIHRLEKSEKNQLWRVTTSDLGSLLRVIHGKSFSPEDWNTVQSSFPGLLEEQ